MGLVRDGENDDDPTVAVAGDDQPLWMGPCDRCGTLITVLGATDDDEHVCHRCRAEA